MNNRPIYIGFTEANVMRRGLGEKVVGDDFYVDVVADGRLAPITGKVVAAYEAHHGKMLIVRNERVGDLLYMLPGWKYYAIWIGCGNSGVLASWKDPIAASRLAAEYAIDDWRHVYAVLRQEQEVRRSLAL